jgi:hypothetical protein
MAIRRLTRSSERRAQRGVVSGIAVSLATLVCMVAFGLPAGAMAPRTGAFGPHAGSRTPISQSVLSHAVAPLTLANIVVTDLASGNAAVYSWNNPAPVYPGSVNCNTSPHDQLCLTYGDVSTVGGTSPGGGSFEVVGGGSGPLGQNSSATMGVSAGGTTCGSGTYNGGDTSSTGFVEVDQYVFTPGPNPVKTVAVQFDCTNSNVDISGTIAYNIIPTDPENGYYLFGQAGELAGFGNDNYLVYLNGAGYYNLNAPIVGMAPTPTGGGYWMVGTDGGVFSSGDAGFYGSTGNIHLNKPIVGMAATPDGKGYWFVASDGGIFAYGDAGFYGSRGGQPLNKPIVGMAPTPDGKGYWLVASDGGIFAYGDAGFFGSTGSIHLNQPVVGMTPTPSGHGYWFVASDGGIFAYGNAQFYGSTGSIHLNKPITGMVAAPDGNGYWFVASDGGVFNYGSAGFAGSLGGSGVDDVAGLSLGI